MSDPEDLRSTLARLAESEGWGAETWDHRRGEHPPADLLVAYGSGELAAMADSDPRVLALREHVATCRECAALVADLAAFPDLPESDGEPSEDQLSLAWEELRRRLPRGVTGPSRPVPVEPLAKSPPGSDDED